MKSHVICPTLKNKEVFVSSLFTATVLCVCPVAQSCLILGNPMSGSSVHGIFQARILEWVAISYFRGIFLTQEWNLCLLHLLHWQAHSLPLCHLGSPATVLDKPNVLPFAVGEAVINMAIFRKVSLVRKSYKPKYLAMT